MVVLENDAVRLGTDKEVEPGTDADEQETEKVGLETVSVGLEIDTEGLEVFLDELGKGTGELEIAVVVQENGAVHGESAVDLKTSRNKQDYRLQNHWLHPLMYSHNCKEAECR